MNENRLELYENTNGKVIAWTLFILFLISFPILAVLYLEQIRNDLINDFNSNKTLVCNVSHVKIEVSKSDNWSIDNSYNFVKGPTELVISRCETKE
ncbi:hypothetical protein [Arcobacter vandammei]|uniref:hypothetical protein n=1 Tax=Arcobacter vandammei TaxID=2782243 RepID=UPI0018DF5E4F|nr:hypothetical protein [Arcobacter vandammei]